MNFFANSESEKEGFSLISMSWTKGALFVAPICSLNQVIDGRAQDY